MTRTFKSYVPTVLTLSKEQLAKVPKGLKVRYGINRAKQKNGDIYVMERAYYIVPETKNRYDSQRGGRHDPCQSEKIHFGQYSGQVGQKSSKHIG